MAETKKTTEIKEAVEPAEKVDALGIPDRKDVTDAVDGQIHMWEKGKETIPPVGEYILYEIGKDPKVITITDPFTWNAYEVGTKLKGPIPEPKE